MNNNNHIPEGWAMPDDMAKRISEQVNKKPYAPEDDLKEALEDMARDIALIEPNPVDWGGWVSYFLDQLEKEAIRKRREFDFSSGLGILINNLQDRIKGK